MGRYIVRRLLWMVLTMFVVSAITFTLMHSVPGGPFDKEKALPPEIIAILDKRYHLNDPLIVQYFDYLSNVIVPKLSSVPPNTSLLDDAIVNIKVGDKQWIKWMNFGPSFTSRSRTVNDIFRQQFPISAQLGLIALIVAVIIGMPLGILAALKQNSFFDYLGMGVAIFGVSVPVIVMGPILVWIFGVTLKWLPPTGWGAQPPFVLGFLPSNLGPDFFRYAAMPCIALGLGSSAIIARLTRASLLQVVREDYIRTARAKGLTERTVVTRHALKNSLIPVVTILGPMFAGLVTGTFVTETIFGIPGMGKYFITSITNRDYPVIMGTILLYAILLVIANLVVDVLYGFLDPRIRYA
ncbi:ABC transporter permease [Candidatus Amarolinea dominans]|uniref:ABC transporter permease n=1 Tax=Candidatus Amarolinea dominans TaxID=3140696 RepID=UPI001D6C6328|nr:ABC transporter permease [Anaerolineae bacterium]